MISFIRQAAYKHGYLLITAAWLYTLSFIFINYWSYNASPEKVQAKLEQRLHRLEDQFRSTVKDTAGLYARLSLQPDITDPLGDRIGLFIFKGDPSKSNLVYWNTNQMYVSREELKTAQGHSFVDNQNGEFELLVKNVSVRGQSYIVMGMIPIRWSYFMENKYLRTEFAGFDRLNEQYEISDNNNALAVKSGDGKVLFHIQLKTGKSFISYDAVTVILRVLAIIFLLIFLQVLAQETVLRYGFSFGFGMLAAIVLLLRLISYLFHFPFDFSKLPLFDPAIYATSFLHPSLGDLLINAILLFWLVNFYKRHYAPAKGWPWKLPPTLHQVIRLLSLAMIGFWMAGVILSLVRDSKIPFDVTNFFGLNIYSVISFVVLCFLVLTFFHFSQILLKPVAGAEPLPLYWQCLTVALFGMGYVVVLVNATETRLYLWVLLWIIGYLVLLDIRKADKDKPLLKSSFFIFWVMLFAMSVATIVLYENSRVEFEQRKRIAEKLAQQTDPSGENLLNIAATNFDDHFLQTNFHRFEDNEFSNKFIKDSLVKQNFSGYLNKYDTQIYTFDSLYHPLFNEDSLSYAAIRTILLNKAKPTLIPGLFSYDNTAEGFSYIYQKEIYQGDHILGYLYVLIQSKRYKSEALYPELFNQVQDVATDLNTNYAYAIYFRGKLINHFNTYGFPAQLTRHQLSQLEFTYLSKNGYTELWYNGSNGKQVMVARQNNWLMEGITLFAYLFCSFLCIILLFHFGNFLIMARFSWRKLREMLRLNIRSQIQTTIIFLSVFSFIIIGIATISFFIIRFNRNNEERLSKSIQVMANEVNSKMTALQAFDDAPDNAGVRAVLGRNISEISDLHNVDINYYDLKGSLVISTQPYIYNKHLLSSRMEPHAYQALQDGQTIRYLQSEKIGRFQYLSIYVPLEDEAGNTYAYLNIPYLNSESELNQEISGFLATLINLNAFIFLIAGAIAFVLTNRITASLSLIGRKMQEMNLGRINEEIAWNRNDEIGWLVQEYNTMVRKLEASAKALAQSEREGAWREMARQVAHEIKNPLTPMKLSIQYLQNAILRDVPNVKEMAAGVAVTLIEQIDQLAKIAGDFSQFANIGNARMEKLDIADVISAVVRLYAMHPDMQIHWQKGTDSCQVFSDRVQLNRLFTNLLQNAVEARQRPDQVAEVRILLTKEQGTILISVQDNCGGIPPEMQGSIFKPNFTTKSSGTGLGLAICRGIVENANGQIRFESALGVGTTFFIRFPEAV